MSLQIYNVNNDKKLSDHFHAHEFFCPCCGYAIIDLRIVDVGEALRAIVGKTVFINSGWRCPAHNSEEHGAEYSRHMKGVAADFDWTGAEMDLLDDKIRDKIKAIYGVMGIGWGKGFVHLDIDDSRPFQTEWRY